MNAERVKKDRSTTDERHSNTLQRYSTAATTALVNLTMGGLHPYRAGGILFSQLRYFDPVEQRPGLPADVGALVTKINNEFVKVIIVNTNQTETRDVVVQTGGYGEHRCERVEIEGKNYPVHDSSFRTVLAPGCGAEITVNYTRFANKPSYAFPWHSE